MLIKLVTTVIAVALLMSGCADINTTNQLIADANKGRMESFASGLAACGDNAACQVGVSMAYAGGMGQQAFFRPDTGLDYFKASGQVIDVLLRGWWMFGDIASNNQDSSTSIKNTGSGDVFFNSDYNKNPAITLSGKASSGTFDFGVSQVGPTTTTTVDRSNDSSSSKSTLW